MKMALKLYNTMSRKKEIFKPIKDVVGLYTCGITCYNYAHIGNLRTYIFEDFLKRVLLYNNFKVKHVMNITDVGHMTSDEDEGEDKMEKGAKREGKTVWEIAEYYTQAFKNDIKLLNIIDPDIWCKATDHIQQQIDMIKVLEEKGFTYETDEGIYMDTSKVKDYGKLARLNLENLKAGARVELDENKKNPTDFALWKFLVGKNKNHIMHWPSPYGEGFPGWHIECSAMSVHYLGEQFDIHCGGIDHIPVHHTNEIAQTESATGKEWVNYWLHGEFLIIDKDKMAKSGENFITMQTLIDKGFDPLDYRYFCLNAHYKSPLTFSWEALEGAKNAFHNLKNRLLELKENPGSKGTKHEEYKKQFLETINDDLNMPQALAVMWDMLKDSEIGNKEKYDLLLDFDKVFGLKLDTVEEDEIPDEILALAEKREKMREEKKWDESDKIRDEVAAKGYVVEDLKDGFKVKKK